MRHLFFVAGLLCLLGAPATSLAASVQTEHWTVFVTEDADQRLTFSVEPLSPTDEPDEPPAPDPYVDEDNDEPQSDEPMEGAAGELLINEFVSDPLPKQEEWVELYNPSGRTVDLTEWTIREGSGRTTGLSGSLEEGEYLVVTSPSGSLNNAGDEISLLDPFGNVIDSLSYGNWEDAIVSAASDPFSVGRSQIDPDSFIRMEQTPGEQNVDPDVEAADTDTDDSDEESDSTQTDDTDTTDTYDPTPLDDTDPDEHTECTPTYTETGSDPVSDDEDVESGPDFISLTNIRTLDVGTELTTEGVVSVVPGILGQQYFYLAGSGVQVYLYSGDFPTLERGDRIRIQGELREASGEARVKLSNASDITILSHEDAPEPHDIDGSQVGEATEGWLVRMTGLVTETSSGEFLLSDTEADVRVVLKDATGIAMDAEVGDTLTVTGIVSQTTSGYRLLPRDQQDILPRTNEADDTAEDVLNAAAGFLGSSSSGSAGGWAVSVATVLSFMGGAAHYMHKEKKWLFA